MRKALFAFCVLPLCLWGCKSDSPSATEVARQKFAPPPPPTLQEINELPDAINKIEEASFYSGFALVQAADKAPDDAVVKRCGYKFNSYFYDEKKLAAAQATNALLFHYSCFNNPLHYEQGRLTDKVVDDEWQETVFFQLPLQNQFRYVNQQLLQVKLCAVHSSFGALESGNGRYVIQNGMLEGRRINDSVYDVQINARYRAVFSDTSYWVPVWVDARFKRQRGFNKPWEYQCPLFKRHN